MHTIGHATRKLKQCGGITHFDPSIRRDRIGCLTRHTYPVLSAAVLWKADAPFFGDYCITTCIVFDAISAQCGEVNFSFVNLRFVHDVLFTFSFRRTPRWQFL